MNLKKKKKLILILLIFCCCFVAVGYFVLIRSVVIEGKVRVEPAVWDVRFENIKTIKTIGKAENYKDPELDSQIIKFYAGFNDVGDSITYKIKIANRGNLNAQLASINFISDNKKYIDYSIKGIEVGTKLKSGKTKTIEVKLKYNGNIDDSFKEYSDTKLILNWKQDTK